ncbi:hypothetical protein [Methylobacterium nonmethylotrophicum]|uniref:Uncharacterized protein n=1 Tax=Methylobacterium nonmethylotrophicum TaxID=1141884 RepID=A0A4Z0NYT7_9HYPH|nr:hypothetical protein [Methylobacterium nonmethylotrophicum]TGE02656.1 hypothetical protein EU555_02525 [Methylobacterium nonmethylotrophicum]
MVPVSDGPTVAAVRAGLVAACAVNGDAPLLLAFRSFVLDDHDPLAGLASRAAEAFGKPGERSARHVATLGYAAAARRLPDALAPVLADGIRWIAERPWHRPLREATLEVDGVSMLGVALGSRGCDDALLPPLAELAVKSAGMKTLSPLNRSLVAAAAHVMGAPGRPDLSVMMPEVRVALADLALMPLDEASGPPAWRAAMRYVPGDGGPARAPLALRAFDALCDRNMPARLGRLEPQDVVRVLEGIVRSFQSWTWEDRPRTPNSTAVKWHVENEYHVQNLLWAVLAPLFPDLRAEEYAAPVGHKNPRMDLTIPSLRLVVEVKFIRAGKSFADILEEIAADHTLYGQDGRWDVLIPFIWDDSRRVEQHATLLQGLRVMPMVHDAVVMPRPGKMDPAATPSSPRRRKKGAATGAPASAPKPARRRS